MEHGHLLPLRARRLEFGLTQAELAQRAGVSRQLVAAVEAGQNTPAVDAALRLALALGTTVEQLFAVPAVGVAPALDDTPREGALVRVARVGDRIVAAELPDHGTAGGGWATPDGVVTGSEVQLFPGAGVDRFVLAGCDPALGIAETMLSGLGRASLLTLSAPTDTVLRSLRERRVHAAAVHGPVGDLPAAPESVLRLHLAGWQVGLALAPGSAAPTLEAALEPNRTIIQRDPAAASQQALARAAARLGREIPSGPRAAGHIEAARLAAILGCPAVTTEAAAHAFGLTFLPLERHRVEIWIADEWLHHPAAEPLGNLLASAAFTDRVAALGGYDLVGTGTVITAG
jgi:transcriptional regulator with XRE-family HTH domain